MSIELLESIIDNPIPFAHALGYTKLTEELHRDWIRTMFFLEENGTLQAHRGSYKTTCLIIALSLRIIAKPEENTILLRKSRDDVNDVIDAVSKVLHSEITMSLIKGIFDLTPSFVADSGTEIELSIYRGTMGRQLLGMGLKSSITGKHGSIITDDIVTVKDRVSEAHRKETKNVYNELINIASERDQFIFNCGTPWHKDDAFSLMPKPQRFTVHDTGIKTTEEIKDIKNSMPGSLYAANYELKHIADGDRLFPEPKYGKIPIGSKSWGHIDAAYGGSDGNALTIMVEVGSTLYFTGWLMEGHVENSYNKICSRLERFQAQGYDAEKNADKGYLVKDLSKQTLITGTSYHEAMNKYFKISTYGKSRWKDVVFDLQEDSTVEEQAEVLAYISQIMDYNENAEHDDAPDSFASLVKRRYYSSEQSFH